METPWHEKKVPVRLRIIHPPAIQLARPSILPLITRNPEQLPGEETGNQRRSLHKGDLSDTGAVSGSDYRQWVAATGEYDAGKMAEMPGC